MRGSYERWNQNLLLHTAALRFHSGIYECKDVKFSALDEIFMTCWPSPILSSIFRIFVLFCFVLLFFLRHTTIQTSGIKWKATKLKIFTEIVRLLANYWSTSVANKYHGKSLRSILRN